MRNTFWLGIFYIFLSAVAFGVMPILAKYAYEGGVNVISLLSLRFLFAALLFFVFLKASGQKWAVQRGQLAALFVLGAVCYMAQSMLYFTAVKYIPASLVALLLYTFPVFVAVLAYLFEGEKITLSIANAIGLSLIGLLLVLGTSFQKVNVLGIGLALGAAVVYSVYIIIGNRVVRGVPPLVTSMFVAIFASMSLLVTGLFSGELSFSFSTKSWLAIAGISLISTVLAMLTFFKGLEYIGSTRASIFSMVEPLVTFIFSALLFGERFTLVQGMGGLIVLTGAALVVYAQGKREKQEKDSQSRTV